MGSTALRLMGIASRSTNMMVIIHPICRVEPVHFQTVSKQKKPTQRINKVENQALKRLAAGYNADKAIPIMAAEMKETNRRR